MRDQDELRSFLQNDCPSVWSLLSRKAQASLPNGLVEYIGEGTCQEIDRGRCLVQGVEHKLLALVDSCGWKAVKDAYRRSFSGADTADQVAELFCEIALCAHIAALSAQLTIRPPTGKGTTSDFSFVRKGSTLVVYGECKRYEDPWPRCGGPTARSLGLHPKECLPPGTARPRSMDLRSKLCDAHRQLPDDTPNILFIFHRSFGETEVYMVQALFGDANFRPANGYCLQNDSLFALPEWRNISLCCLVSVMENQEVGFLRRWENPNACLKTPPEVLQMLEAPGTIAG